MIVRVETGTYTRGVSRDAAAHPPFRLGSICVRMAWALRCPHPDVLETSHGSHNGIRDDLYFELIHRPFGEFDLGPL